MDLLKRCSGSTICVYTKRFQRACFSILSRHQMLPSGLEELSGLPTVSRQLIFTRRQQSTVRAVNYAKSVRLPPVVQHNLDRLQSDVFAAIAPPDSTGGDGAIPQFSDMIRYYFEDGGKLVRPTVSLLVSCACTPLSASEEIVVEQRKMAVVAEMLHTASLVHDDVIDEAATRRRRPSINNLWGDKKAVLVGDYILAKATQLLCSIGRPDVITIFAQIIEDLVKGELMQMGTRTSSPADRFNHYLEKTFKKTASLFAQSCRAVALIAGCSEQTCDAAFAYGRAVGMSFQIADDLLDFVSTSAALGKPAATDLKLGLATAPVLYAAAVHPELDELIARRFSAAGDVRRAVELVRASDGLPRARALAQSYCDAAVAQVGWLVGGALVDGALQIPLLPNAALYREPLIDVANAQLCRVA